MIFNQFCVRISKKSKVERKIYLAEEMRWLISRKREIVWYIHSIEEEFFLEQKYGKKITKRAKEEYAFP